MRLNGDDIQVEISISKLAELIHHSDYCAIAILFNELSGWLDEDTVNAMIPHLNQSSYDLIYVLYNATKEKMKI